MARTADPRLIVAACVTAAAVLVGAGLPAASATAGPARGGPSASGLQSDVSRLVAAGAPGIVLITRRGSRLDQLARGVAELRRHTPMRTDDRFRIGSLTKTYVATVVLQLVAERKIALTDTVERWLPGLVPNGSQITIRQLLNHTSGLPDFDQDPRFLKPYLSGHLRHHWPPRALVRIATSHKPLFAPGARYSYSNTNYLLAGLIIEAVTGHSLGAELKARIFVPLGLRATSFQTRSGLPAPYAHGYFVLSQPPASDVSDLSPFPWAAGAIVSTGREVATFYRALLRHRLLPDPELRLMKMTVSEGAQASIPGARYGLGMEAFPVPCGRAWGEAGTFPGYVAFSVNSEDGNSQAVVLVNKDLSLLSRRAVRRFFTLLGDAYCSHRASLRG
jgi:D-alanyl-D-alanine carboxypeptidase